MARRRSAESRPSASDELDLFASEPTPRYDRRRSAPTADATPIELPAALPGSSPGNAIRIADLTITAKEILEGAFPPLWVRGEVSDFKRHRNGHWYFCLRDEAAQVRCVVWSRDQRRMLASPDDGMQIVARGQLSVYPARGDMQFVVSELDSIGDGLYRKALELAREELERDGLLDPARKRKLPRLPRRIAVVTSPDGAALHDIIAVVGRRCATVELVVVATKVQGDGAPEEIVAALERVARWGGADVVIVGRGGGAREDLWAFNDPRVARAVAMCPVPTVSAVGHEVDITLCDLVADVRAPTPSAAAECAVPMLAAERESLALTAAILRSAMERRLQHASRTIDHTRRDVQRVSSAVVERRRGRAEVAAARLHALSPLATLARGYAVARDEAGVALTRREQFSAGLPFVLTLRDGDVRAQVDDSERAP